MRYAPPMSAPDGARRIGVLLLQLGGPDRLSAVTPFLENLFSDPDILPVPGGPRIQRLLARLIARARTRKVEGYYRRIGGGSPLRRLTELQAERLREELGRRAAARPAGELEFQVAVAMRYWEPDTAAALDRVADAEALIALTLFPHYSRATTGSSLRELARVREARGDRRPLVQVDRWFDAPDYLAALAERIRAAARALPQATSAGTLILWSAHGLPEKIVAAGDPYVAHIEATVAGTMAQLADLGLPHRLSYQSRTGPIRWTGPATEDVIREEAARGRRALVVVPVSFVSDHIETLYEIDILYAEAARREGIETFVRSESFNGGADLTRVLARLTEEAALAAGWLGVASPMARP
jgi:protoporphyrin/coproporphyrin ferrochelatase